MATSLIDGASSGPQDASVHPGSIGPSPQRRGPKLPLHLVCAVLSGSAGLIYQIAWSKALALLFGFSVYAVATCVAVFLGGLALGSASFASRPGRNGDAMALYAWLEVGIAAGGGLSLFGLAAVRAAWLALDPLSSSRMLTLLERLAGSAAVLLVPTFFMGATFPVLVRGAVALEPSLRTRVARLYGWNTLGAVSGALLAGFVLLPRVGLRETIACAIALNLFAGLLALRVARRLPRGERDAAAPVSRSATPPRGLLGALGLVGATAIAYEIAWTRLLATTLGSSTYAFTLILAMLLTGLAVGSLLFQRTRTRATLGTFSLVQTAVALAVVIFLATFHNLPPLVPRVLRAMGGGFHGLIAGQALISSLAILPCAVLLGFNFPLVLLVFPHENASIGRAYAANTIGAIVAALAGGFVLLPALGAYRLIAVAGAVNALLAMALARFAARPGRLVAVDATLLVALAWLGVSSHFFRPATAAFGAALYGTLPGSHLSYQEIVDTEDVLFLEEGLNATIAVTRSEAYVALKTNGKVDASSLDQSTQLLLGDLGAIFHPHPRHVLIIGFGSGMTASAVTRFHDVERIDCVELEPAVLRAAPALELLHRGVVRDPRLHLFVDDARNLIQASRELYDLIISEPSNPWIAGVATLFTDEFYEALRRRLAPGGMLVQWVQGYAMQPDDFRMVVASIAPHFADLSLFGSQGRDYMILARTDHQSLNFERARSLWADASMAEDFRALHVAAPEGWLAYLRLGDVEIRGLAARAPRNTDDLTALEYETPRAVLDEHLGSALDALISAAQRDVLGDEVAPADRRSALMAAAASQIEMQNPRAERTLDALSGEQPSAELELLHGRVQLLRGRPDEALRHFQIAVGGADPNAVQYWTAMAERALGNGERAAGLLETVIRRDPKHLEALETLVAVEREQRNWPRAIAAQEEVIRQRAAPAAADHCQLGDLDLRAGRRAAAEAAFRRGLFLEPYSFLCRRDLGDLERVTARPSEARTDLEFVVRYFPEADPKTYVSLALLHKAQGRWGDAEATLQKGRRIFPEDPTLRAFDLTGADTLTR